jgi:DNA polymerase I-like protein with 3'-5' exonuclease and polymerase domains/intein/homing endonuclease
MDFMEALDALALPKVERKPWMLKTTMERVTADTLSRVVDECIAAGIYGLDLETTGLDNRVFYRDDGTPYTVDKIVGYCLAPSEDKGYYLPVRHRNPKTGESDPTNVPLRLVIPEMQRLVNSPAKIVLHNAKFDQEFLQHEEGGGIGAEAWDDTDKWDDTFILAYMRNTRERNKGLKHLSSVELSREMIELTELFSPEDVKKGNLNFGNLDPSWEPAIWYACSDAMCTLGLRRVLHPQVTEPDAHKIDQKSLYRIEKACVSATRWMERCRIPIDRPKVGELIRIGQREWFACLVDVYAEVNRILDRDSRPKWMEVMQNHPTLRFDPESVEPSYMDARETAMAHVGEEYPTFVEKSVLSLTDARKMETVAFPLTYDITIPEQLGLLMRELGVRGLRATEKSGQVKTSKDELERVIEEAGDEYPFMGKIRRFREVAKALSSNLFPIWLDTSPERSPDGRIRVSFNAHKVDTGRFSTPTPRDEDRFTGQVRWNLHSIPATYDKKKPECMRRMREIIRVPEGKVLYAIDYSGVELRIVTNLSGEPKWMDEFFRCSECDTKFDRGQGSAPPPHFCPKCGSDKIGDLHTLTALAIYGEKAKESPEFKQMRQSSKALNFAMCYGGGGSAAQRAVGVDKEEGWRIKNQFDKSYKGLQRWWGKQHETARKQVYVTTAYGRKYPLPDILHTDGGFRSKAERNAVNGPVQGCLHPDTKIMTSEGLVTVRDIYQRGAKFKVWTGQGWAEARPLYSGLKPIRVTNFTSGASIKTSPEHLFLTWRDQTPNPANMADVVEWVRQQELEIGDWVATSTEAVEWPEPHYRWVYEERSQDGHLFSKGMTPHNYKGFAIDGNSEALWEFLGLVYGDGSIHADRFDIHVGEVAVKGYDGPSAKEIATTYADKINAALGVGAHIYEKARSKTEPTKRAVWQVVVCNKAFRDFCREVIGVEDQNTYTKRFPAALWRESSKHRAAFLRGYFSADGHTSASGDAVSVRSVNLGLLHDTQDLLRSLGIRSSCREKSLRASVLDREKYAERIGFILPHKAKRLASRKSNSWVHQWDIAPPHLVRWVGETVYASSVYAGLPRAQKSAVSRLKIGSGSRHQCNVYLGKIPDAEVPPDLRRLLRYGWERVTVSRDTGDAVEMYDVEVYDDFHAFVADGCVVHNTSADIMKLAMVLIYREYKKRGWLNKAKAIITIHDELVFEVDGDVAEEMVDITVPLMVEKTVAPLRWLVPLKVDIEFGQDWLVPNNLIEMEHGKKAWPEKWARMFPRRSQGASPAPSVSPPIAEPTGDKSSTVTGRTLEPPSVLSPVHSSIREGNQESATVPGTSVEGGKCVHVIHTTRLAFGLMDKLARVIQRCEGRGTSPLRVVTETGIVLFDEGEQVKVAPGEFKTIAMYEGI